MNERAVKMEIRDEATLEQVRQDALDAIEKDYVDALGGRGLLYAMIKTRGWRLINCRADTEDLLNELYMKARADILRINDVTRLENLAGNSGLRRSMYTGDIKDIARLASTTQKGLEDEFDPTLDFRGYTADTSAPSPEVTTSAEEGLGQIEDIIKSTKKFSEEKKERVLLIIRRLMRGNDSGEIAEELGVDSSRVGQLYRDLEELLYMESEDISLPPKIGELANILTHGSKSSKKKTERGREERARVVKKLEELLDNLESTPDYELTNKIEIEDAELKSYIIDYLKYILGKIDETTTFDRLKHTRKLRKIKRVICEEIGVNTSYMFNRKNFTPFVSK